MPLHSDRQPDCGCVVAWREYHTTPDMKCTVHKADGSKKDVPLTRTTVNAMAVGGQHRKYWAERKARQDERGGDDTVHVCPAGCAYMPGTRIKGHLTHKCEAHQNLDDDNLQSQVFTAECGCKTRQITAGEGRSEGRVLFQKLVVCPRHRT